MSKAVRVWLIMQIFNWPLRHKRGKGGSRRCTKHKSHKGESRERTEKKTDFNQTDRIVNRICMNNGVINTLFSQWRIKV